MKRPRSGGGWKAIGYSMKLASRVGWWKMWKAMRSKNACKTCAVGMGGQLHAVANGLPAASAVWSFHSEPASSAFSSAEGFGDGLSVVAPSSAVPDPGDSMSSI